MSIVAVHGPTMWGGTGAGGAGTGATITAPGGGAGMAVQATADMTNGLKFTFQWTGTTTPSNKPDADFDWAFPGGSPATAADTKGPVVVTYTTPGAKVATLTVSGTGTPAAAAYPITVQADTSPGGVQTVDNAGGTVTGDAQNGALFTLAGKGDRAAADYDWTFSDGTAAILNTKSTTVTFTTSGQKTITLTLGTSGGTTPPGGVYTFQVNAYVGAQPRSLMAPYDPGAHTVAEVEQYVTDNPDQVEEVYALELEGKNRSTLIAWLEAFQPA